LRTEQANQSAKAAQLGTIIELTKNLKRSHEMANRAEKRRIVESTSSNRVVIGKKIYLEPQKWLLEVRNIASTPSGDPLRSKDRTSESIIAGYRKANEELKVLEGHDETILAAIKVRKIV